MPRVYVGLGSNIDAERNLRFGIKSLGEHFGVLTLSNVYESAALGFEGDHFWNLVAAFDTEESPSGIVSIIEGIHKAAGRKRGESRYSPRTLDIDLLLYDDAVINEPPVRVPREDTIEYSFVLGPLAEIAPDYRHPISGRTLGDHWAEYDKTRHPISPIDVTL